MSCLHRFRESVFIAMVLHPRSPFSHFVCSLVPAPRHRILHLWGPWDQLSQTMKSSGNQNLTKPTVEDMKAVFALCRDNHWDDIHRRLEVNPWIALTPMVMVNHISSTVLHQAITSRGNVERRAEVIRLILTMTPQAASIRNGYGSLPLHVIAQRNTKMAARVKENLIGLLIKADPMALLEPGGVGRRTPLHIIFTGTSPLRSASSF